MTDKPYPGGVHFDYTNLDSVKVSGTGGGTHSVLGEPVRTTIDFPNSSELSEMAHREWKNRQERKGHDDEVAWTSGWISGYLTGKGSLSSELKKERERVLKALSLWSEENLKGYHGVDMPNRMLQSELQSLRGEP